MKTAVLAELGRRRIARNPRIEAIGESLAFSQNAGDSQDGLILGVLEDFHFESLHHPIRPMVMNYGPWSWAYSYSGIRIDPQDAAATVAFMRQPALANLPGCLRGVQRQRFWQVAPISGCG